MLPIIAVQLYHLREVGLPCEHILDSATIEHKSVSRNLKAGSSIVNRSDLQELGRIVVASESEFTRPMGPSRKTLNKLYALSRNQCAFRNCDALIIEGADTVTGVLCHIKARRPGGPRYDATQTDEQRHSDANLILLCAKHAKIIDSEPERYTVAELREMKRLHEQPGPVEISQADAQRGELLFRHYGDVSITSGGNVMVNSPGAVQASQVVFEGVRKTVKMVPIAGSLASDLSRRNYVKHLVDRYHEFAKQQQGRAFRYQAVYAAIKRRFGADWGNIPLQQFESLVEFLQHKIDRTVLGSMNRGKGIPNYSTFAQYREKYECGEAPKG